MMNTETSYNQALDYLYSFVDYSLKHIQGAYPIPARQG
jgi:hypothetical protein